MTQQDEAGQDAAAEQVSPLGQPAPPPPSPYLEPGESVPQAYPAPPQPGQPKYGSASGFGPGQRPLRGQRFTQPGSAQPGYGQPGDRQPGFGQSRQPGYRPTGIGGRQPFGRGGQARRDPALAGIWERLIASALDWIVIVVASVVVFWAPLSRVWRELRAVTANYQDLGSPAAQAAIDSISRNPANQHALVYWFLGMFGIALVYYWVQHAAWGATLGKRVLGMRVVTASDRSRIGIKAAGIRALTFLIGPAVFLMVASPINLLGGVLWVADTGLPLLDPRAQCLHDKLAGTVVVRQRWLDQQARSASPW